MKVSKAAKLCLEYHKSHSKENTYRAYNRSPSLNHSNILLLEDDIFEMNKLQISNGYLNSVRFSLN
jgi:hypothetical protein